MGNAYRIEWAAELGVESSVYATLDDAVIATLGIGVDLDGQVQELIVAFEDDGRIAIHPLSPKDRDRERPVGLIVPAPDATGSEATDRTPYTLTRHPQRPRTYPSLEKAIEGARRLYPGCHLETEDLAYYSNEGDDDDDGFRVHIHERRGYFGGWDDFNTNGGVIEPATKATPKRSKKARELATA